MQHEILPSVPLSGHIVGIVLKELLRRAMITIEAKRHSFIASAKQGVDGRPDVVTDADTAVQAIFAKVLTECFPGFGIVGEEKLYQPCTLPGVQAFFTVDPLDGTKAFTRRQSHGVGSMVGLVVNGEIVSAWIADVFTGSIYGYRPGGHAVHWIPRSNPAVALNQVTRVPDPSLGYLGLRDAPEAEMRKEGSPYEFLVDSL